jgi:hypothetical protein
VPGGIFVVHRLEPTLAVIMAGLNQDKLTIAFSRAKGGSDVQIAIDMSVEETSADAQRKRSSKAVMEFLSCAQQLVKDAM